MAATPDEVAAIREHIGSTTPPTSDDLHILWERLGSVESVALAVVRGRLADLRSRPARLSVDGDYTEDHTETIKALERQEARLYAAVIAGSGQGPVVSVARLTRAGRAR